MQPEQLLEELAKRGRLPVEAIRAAEANRTEAVPDQIALREAS